MKRIDFIKGLMALGGLSFISKKFVEAKQYQKFYLLQSFVRGFRFYEGPSIIGEMKEGDLLELVREYNNEYDPCAIALHWNNKKIGFIPAEDNEMLSKLLDIGVPELIAEIIFLKPEASAWENVNIAVYVLKEIPHADQIPSIAAYLTELETPHYRTIKRADQTITRLFVDKKSSETDMKTVNAFEWLMINSKDDRVKKIIRDVVDNKADYASQVDFLVVNRKGLKQDLLDKFKALESELYNVDEMFAEDGLIVLQVAKMDSFVDQISNVVNITDKLGRKFLELKF